MPVIEESRVTAARVTNCCRSHAESRWVEGEMPAGEGCDSEPDDKLGFPFTSRDRWKALARRRGTNCANCGTS